MSAHPQYQVLYLIEFSALDLAVLPFEFSLTA
jgi:hypothetical protein